MPARTIAQIFQYRQQRTDKLVELVPAGTIISASQSHDLATLWESPSGEYRGVFLGRGEIPSHGLRVKPDESDREWMLAPEEVRFWFHDRWWTFDDIVGLWE